MSPRIGLDRQDVLLAAVEVADSEGTGAVSMSSVARKLGIRPPSLYNHVSGLEEIRTMLAVYALNQLYDQIQSKAGSIIGEKALRIFAFTYLNFASEHSGLYEAIQIPPRPDDAPLQEASQRFINLILHYLSSYKLTEEEALHTVRGIRSLIHGFASLKRQGGFGLPLEVQDSLQFNLDLILEGLERTHLA